MEFEIADPYCSKCGDIARRMLETLTGWADIFRPEEKEITGYAYEGSTEMCYDSQIPVRDEKNLVTVSCGTGHMWQTALRLKE